MKDAQYISSCLTLSTSHISERDNRELLRSFGKARPWWFKAEYPEGYFFLVPLEFDSVALLNGYGDPGIYLESLVPIFELARALDCWLVRLDADAEVHPKLRTYEW